MAEPIFIYHSTGNYALAVKTGSLLFLGTSRLQSIHFQHRVAHTLCTPSHTAGHIPIGPGGGVMTGKVGADVSLEKAQEAARTIAINILATLKGAFFFFF